MAYIIDRKAIFWRLIISIFIINFFNHMAFVLLFETVVYSNLVELLETTDNFLFYNLTIEFLIKKKYLLIDCCVLTQST